MTHPHVMQEDRDAIEDRGLVDDDRTEEMRRPPAGTRDLRFEPIHTQQEKQARRSS